MDESQTTGEVRFARHSFSFRLSYLVFGPLFPLSTISYPAVTYASLGSLSIRYSALAAVH